jgi:hypothetical protein
MNKIAIAPSRDWTPPPGDPYIARYGRLFEFRSQWLPIAQTHDQTNLLVPAALRNSTGGVGLPDLPDPTWRADAWSDDEVQGKVTRPIEKDMARMIPQRLEDRAERPNGKLGYLEGTNFLVFQPVYSIAFQPERDRQLQAQVWLIKAEYDEATQTNMALLVDPSTGEMLFFGGRYDIIANEG